MNYEKLREALTNSAPGPHRSAPEFRIVNKGGGRFEVPQCLVELAAAAHGRLKNSGEGIAELLAERDALRAELDAKALAPETAEADAWWTP